MEDLLKSVNDVVDEMFSQAVATIASSPTLMCFYLAAIRDSFQGLEMEIRQREIDDAELLSEMRALVYGEGW